jgi:hypothetical protein
LRAPLGERRVCPMHRLLSLNRRWAVSAQLIRACSALYRKKLPRIDHLTGNEATWNWGHELRWWALRIGHGTERGPACKPWIPDAVVRGFSLRRLASWVLLARMRIVNWLGPATTLLNLGFKRVNQT